MLLPNKQRNEDGNNNLCIIAGPKQLKYMMDFGSITPIEALKDLAVMRLGARIYDLEKQGFEITHDRETAKNRYGENTTYCRYSLKKPEVTAT